MADPELQEFVRAAITGLAFGNDPYEALIKIAEHVGLPVMRDDEGHAYIAPAESIWIGDTVKLTGEAWLDLGIHNSEAVITGIDQDGDPYFADPTGTAGGNGTLVVYRGYAEGFDFSATLVRKAT